MDSINRLPLTSTIRRIVAWMITRGGTPAQSKAAYRKMNTLYRAHERDAEKFGRVFSYTCSQCSGNRIARADSFVIPFPFFPFPRAVADRRLYSTSESWGVRRPSPFRLLKISEG